jgi:hypothetical protein
MGVKGGVVNGLSGADVLTGEGQGIESGEVVREKAKGVVVVGEADGCWVIVGAVKDVDCGWGEAVYGEGADFFGDEGFLVRFAEAVQLHVGNRDCHGAGGDGDGVDQAWVGLTDPDFGGTEAQGVEVDHRFDVRELLGAELFDIEAGANEAAFFSCEADEEEGVLAGSGSEGLEEAGKQGGTAPVVDDTIAVVDVIKVSSDEDGRWGGSGKEADDVGLFSGGDWLFGEIFGETACFKEEPFECDFALGVVAFIEIESLLDCVWRDRVLLRE